MKSNPLLSFAVLSLLMAAWFGVSAQDTTGYWLWSQKIIGQEFQTSYCNEIVNMETDVEGNIYYFGTFGSKASYGNAGSGGYVTDELSSDIINFSKLNLWIAKYTREGEKVWQKVVSTCRFNDLDAGWMELHNDTLYITGSYYFEYHMAGGRWMWFYDTLITSEDIATSPDDTHRPPFVSGDWTFITKMDLDGNVFNTFFVQGQDRYEFPGGGHARNRLSYERRTPIHTDRDGNIYFLSVFNYSGDENVPYVLSVYNGDSIWNHDLYLPGSYAADDAATGRAVYKFNPDGRLIWQKRFFEKAENVQTSANTVRNYRFAHSGFAADEDDNLYFSGHVENAVYDDPTQYPVRVFVDSTRYVEITSPMEAKFTVPYLFSIDTSGAVRYLRQAHKSSNHSITNYGLTVTFHGLTVSDSSIYVLGNIGYDPATDTIELADGVFFDHENYLEQQAFPLFIRYDKETGELRNYGTSHVRGLATAGTIAGQYLYMSISSPIGLGYEQHFVSGNRLFALMDHLSGPQVENYYLGQWCTDGTFIDTVFLHRETGVRAHLLQPQPDGDLLAAFLATGDFSLGDEFYYGSSTGSALFGVYHNDVYAHAYPYTGIDNFQSATDQQPAVSLYPNPGVDFVTVRLHRPDDIIRTVEVFDLNGRRILSTSQSTVNVTPLPSGTYLFRITTADNVFHTKFVKQRLE